MDRVQIAFDIKTIDREAIRNHAIDEYENGKRECCGLIYDDGSVKPAKNIADDPTLNFVLDPEYFKDWANVTAIYHSHTNGYSKFSPADVRCARETCLPLILYDIVNNRFSHIDPTGMTPYLGRDFVYGIYDCYSLIRDYYRREFKIILNDYDRSELYNSDGKLDWQTPGWNLFMNNFEKEGFKESDDIKHGDVLLMQFGNYPTPHHLGIITNPDDGIFMHQMLNRKSCAELYGGEWVNYTVKILRHVNHN